MRLPSATTLVQACLVLLMCTLCSVALAAETPALFLSNSELVATANRITERFRKMIVLAEEGRQLDIAARERDTIIGRMIFHENQHDLMVLSGRLTAALRVRAGTQPDSLGWFLDWLEKELSLWDADKLAFRDVLEELTDEGSEAARRNARLRPLASRLADDFKVVRRIEQRYRDELKRVMTQFGVRAMAEHRASWNQYVAHLRTRHTRTAILREYDPGTAIIPAHRGNAESTDEITGSRLPRKTLVLTFDDGPHPRYTDRINEILRKYGVRSVFFHVGSNLGQVNGDDSVVRTKSAAASERLRASGSVLANHSYTHPVLPKLTRDQIEDELRRTNRLLADVGQSEPVLFRPPYGARDAQVLALARANNLKTIMWNIDSKDWADPVSESIAQRVLDEVRTQDRGIILFHDIQYRTIDALERVLAELTKEGYQFAVWNGKEFSAEPTDSATATPPGDRLYRESWAAIIGVDSYLHWPKLSYAANDARAVRDKLVSKYGFKPENVFTLENEQATRENILSLLGSTLANPDRVKRDDRVFIFFAGHGTTRTLASGRELGYLIPVESKASDYFGQAISMTNFRDIAEAIPAKHILFVMDSCYSGLGLTRGGGKGASRSYLQDLSRRSARQLLTAGGADQQVSDSGPNGHSVFTWTLLQGLDGNGDLNSDGYITASELAAYVGPIVASIAPQTPAFGTLPGSEGGDFIFQVNRDQDYLSELSTQLDDQELELNKRISRLQGEITKKRERIQKLQREAEAAEQAARRLDDSADSGDNPARMATIHNDRGLALYKARDYEAALKEFESAVRLNPADPQATNNVGFVLFKLGRHDESIRWLEKTIALDPKRAVAYRNLGEAYEKLNRPSEARRAYESYLGLGPPAASAHTIRGRLQTIGLGQ